MIQSCGSYDGDAYSVSLAHGDLAFTLDGLTQTDVEGLADLFMCLLYRDEEPYTWHSELEPNDVY
jgi:hypothetical protein